jgi:hypothetical protein
VPDDVGSVLEIARVRDEYSGCNCVHMATVTKHGYVRCRTVFMQPRRKFASGNTVVAARGKTKY